MHLDEPVAPQLAHTAAVVAARFGSLLLVAHLIETRGVSHLESQGCHACLSCVPIGPSHPTGERHMCSATEGVIHGAAVAGSIEILAYLLGKGASPNLKDQVPWVSIAITCVHFELCLC